MLSTSRLRQNSALGGTYEEVSPKTVLCNVQVQSQF